MEYLIRFSQSYETFRLPEIQALAVIEGIDLEVVSYSLEVKCPYLAGWFTHPLQHFASKPMHTYYLCFT